MFFVVAYLMKRIYFATHDRNPFLWTMKRVVVLSIFVQTMNSFGIDWVVSETVPLVVSIYLYRYFFAATRSRSGDITPVSA
jgi:hypothetical protein